MKQDVNKPRQFRFRRVSTSEARELRRVFSDMLEEMVQNDTFCAAPDAPKDRMEMLYNLITNHSINLDTQCYERNSSPQVRSIANTVFGIAEVFNDIIMNNPVYPLKEIPLAYPANDDLRAGYEFGYSAMLLILTDITALALKSEIEKTEMPQTQYMIRHRPGYSNRADATKAAIIQKGDFLILIPGMDPINALAAYVKKKKGNADETKVEAYLDQVLAEGDIEKSKRAGELYAQMLQYKENKSERPESKAKKYLFNGVEISARDYNFLVKQGVIVPE